MSNREAEMIQRASRLHDIGKVAISDDVLLKPGGLTEQERSQMQRHAEIGYYVLSGSEDELLKTAAAIALSHHERFDGAGYPAGLAGDAIPLEGRIVAVVDVYDALTSDRVYRPAYARERALSLMREQRGAQFDPEVLDAFLSEVDDRAADDGGSVSASL
jgi:putative two-component system response regulator